LAIYRQSHAGSGLLHLPVRLENPAQGFIWNSWTTRSIDFVFSFDSLVHVESDILEIYLGQLAKKFKPNAVGFIHHSNIGEYPAQDSSPNKRIPEKMKEFLMERGYYDNSHSRAFSMTAPRFESLCQKAGLQRISQEIVNWGSKRLIDCMSVFTLAGSQWSRANRVVRNPQFMAEALLAKRIAPLYMSR
jgi:hypothetical protein